MILNGGNEIFSVESKTLGLTRKYDIDFEGIIPFIEDQFEDNSNARIRRWAKAFMDNIECESCLGSRLNKESRNFLIDLKSINDLSKMDIIELKNGFHRSIQNFQKENKL